MLASALLVAAWGYFLYQGIIDPSGIATALWPIFGIANQLLAVIAFCLGTTILVKMGRARYAWTTGVPLVFLLVVTFTAGTMKIFSAKAAGFLPAISGVEAKLAVATDPVVAAKLRATLINLRVDVGITVFFLVMVGVIVSGCAVEWVRILTGRKRAVLWEAPYATLPECS